MINLKNVVFVGDVFSYNDYHCSSVEKKIKKILANRKDIRINRMSFDGIDKFNVSVLNTDNFSLFSHFINSEIFKSEDKKQNAVFILPDFNISFEIMKKSLSEEHTYILTGDRVSKARSILKDFLTINKDFLSEEENLKQIKSNIKLKKEEIKKTKKDIKKMKKESFDLDDNIVMVLERGLLILEEELSSLNIEKMKKETLIKALESDLKITTLSNKFKMSYYILGDICSFDIVYGGKDILILKKNFTNTKFKGDFSVSKTVLDFTDKWINFETKDDIDEVLEKNIKGIDFGLEVKGINSIWGLNKFHNLINEQIDIKIDLSLSMENVSPLAPVKSNIAASMVASGAAGKFSKEILINENEQALMKSVMIQDVTTTKIVVNNVQETVSTFVWKTQLGIFNKLRKEIELYKD